MKTLRDIVVCLIVTAFLLLLVLDAGATSQPDRGATLWMWEQPRLSVTATPTPAALTFFSPLPDGDPRCVFLSPVFIPGLP